MNVDRLRARLVDQLLAAGAVRDERVARAFRSVPRHLFLPGLEPERAYRDEPVPTKWAPDGFPISSSSQPAVMAVMLEQLDVRPGHRILEVGAGTGYNAALLASLAGECGQVVTLDIDEDVAERARRNLAAAGVDRVAVRCADGAAGWADAAPYHRVILTVGAWDLAPAWVDQLARGGRLVLPLSLHRVQRSVAFERAGDHLASVSVRPCGFMMLRGSMAGPESIQSLGHALFLELGGDSPIDPAAVRAALARPGLELPLRMRVTGREVFDGLTLWLALHEPDVGSLAALDSAPERDLVPPLCTLGGMTSTHVLVEGEALAALVRLGGDGSGAVEDDSFELGVRGYGPGSEALASRLADAVQRWQRRGRPSTTGLRIRAYFAGTEAGTEADAEAAAVIDKRYSRLVVDWRQDHSA